jgi:hypothetical protein
MCRRVSCQKCGKPDWAGCGAHIEQVLGDVAAKDRCQCRENAGPPPSSRWSLASLFGKKT